MNDKPLWDVGEVAKKQDKKPKEKPPKRWCPLRIEMLSKGCIGSSCEWYSDSGCAISVIAKRLK